MAPAVAAAAVFGTLIGSFLTVVVARVPERESIVAPGSACPRCGHVLRWRENVPIASWLALRGRCSQCGERIGIRYPALEAGTGLAFAGVVAARGVGPHLVLELFFTGALIALAVIDLERRVVPNPILVVSAVWGIAAGAAVDPGHLPTQLVAGAAAFAAFLLLALAYPAGMGMGDVKLAGVMGLFLGVDVLPALAVAFLTGTIVGVTIAVRSGEGRAGGKRAVPFAPFLALGGYVGIVAGPELIELYRSAFLH